jgi:hypothetical protein
VIRSIDYENISKQRTFEVINRDLDTTYKTYSKTILKISTMSEIEDKIAAAEMLAEFEVKDDALPGENRAAYAIRKEREVIIENSKNHTNEKK